MSSLAVIAASSAESTIVTDLVVILVTASVVAMAAQRLRLALIPAYLIAGGLAGPKALGLVPEPGALGVISHLAIVLLLFGIGLELHLSVLKHRFLQVTLAGLASCVLCTAIGWPLALAFGLSSPAALQVAMALSLSSTAVVLRILSRQRELHHTSGRLALATLVVQDLLVLAMLAVLPLLARWAGKDPADPVLLGLGPEPVRSWSAYLIDAALRLVGMGVLAIGGRVLLPRILRESTRHQSVEIMMVVGVATALLMALMAERLGFSLEMGAFLAGFILADTRFRHQLSALIGPLRDIFLAVFFTTVGMKLDPQILLANWWLILVAVGTLIVLKATAIGTACWSAGATAGIAVTVGLCLSQAGEFSLILLDAAHGLGMFTERTLAVLIAVIVVSLVLTPALMGAGRRFGRALCGLPSAPWMRGAELRDPTGGEHARDEISMHVIVAGYGPTGRLVVEKLEQAGMPYTVVELNSRTVQAEQAKGKSILFGDVSSPDVLESAGIAEADALILTIPDESAVLRACAIARRRRPDIYIAARTHMASRATLAREIGATHVTTDESVTAEAMADSVMRHIGACPLGQRGGDPQALTSD